MALLTVNVGDCKVSRNPSDILVTHALGSCIAVVFYDPAVQVAGLLHYMLPESGLDPAKAQARPFLFADTGIPLLLKNAVHLGAAESRSLVVVTGGAHMLGLKGSFDIGQRNHFAVKEALLKAGFRAHHEEVGGTSSRTISIKVANGHILFKTPGVADREMLLGGGVPCLT